MLERILEIIKRKNLTPSQFADEIGIQRSGISHIISGRNNPSLEFVMKVLKRYPDIKAEWLLYGTGDSEKSNTPAETIIIDTETDKVPEPKPVEKVETLSPVTLFDEPEITDVKPESKTPKSVRKEKTVRKIEKIVVFYDDRTFREYEPEQY